MSVCGKDRIYTWENVKESHYIDDKILKYAQKIADLVLCLK